MVSMTWRVIATGKSIWRKVLRVLRDNFISYNFLDIENRFVKKKNYSWKKFNNVNGKLFPFFFCCWKHFLYCFSMEMCKLYQFNIRRKMVVYTSKLLWESMKKMRKKINWKLNLMQKTCILVKFSSFSPKAIKSFVLLLLQI